MATELSASLASTFTAEQLAPFAAAHLTDNRNGDHLKQHADIRNEPELITSKPNLAGLDAVFAEFGRKPPRFRELEVSDEHCVELLTAVASLLLAHRKAGTKPSMALLEMQAALNEMVAS
jgi:hypothetical protein